MIKELKLENFRCFKSFACKLSQVTILGGLNSVGKTAILEAIALFYSYSRADVFAMLDLSRGINEIEATPALWESYFYDFDSKNTMKISVDVSSVEFKRDDRNLTRNLPIKDIDPSSYFYSLRFQYKGKKIQAGNYVLSSESLNIVWDGGQKTDLTPKDMLYVSTKASDSANMTANRLGRVELNGKKNKIIEILQKFDNHIKNITTVVVGNVGYIYIDIQNKKLPINVMGDGINKLLRLLLAIYSGEAKIILFDEFENGIHHSAMDTVWQGVLHAVAEEKIQLIVTTHSYECLQSAVKATDGKIDDFSYIRLDNSQGKIVPHIFSLSDAKLAIDAEFEIR